MTRRFLLITSFVTAISAVSPAAFSAALVSSGKSLNPKAASGKTVSKRDIERLFVATRGDIASAPLTLSKSSGGKTLSGMEAIVVESSFSLSAAAAASAPFEVAMLEPAAAASVAPVLPPAPAPVPAQNLGPASEFAAVPEPSSIALVAMGAFAFLRRRRA